MSTATTSLVGYYHCSTAGQAYVAVGKYRAAPLTVDLLCLLQSLGDAMIMRVLGVPENAEFMLLCRKYRPDIMLEVGGPGLCLHQAELQRPDLVIQRMRQALLSPSLGGFHRWKFPDLAAYQLVRLMHDKPRSERAQQAAMVHPAWYDLTFLPTLAEYPAARLLAMIIDPRWFVDPDHPDRISRVKAFLGLTPAIQRDVSCGNTATAAAKRCYLVRSCWCGMHQQWKPDLAAPGNFLWRIHAAAGDPVMGSLRASQAFITYLIRTWQHRIAVETLPYLKEPLFVPERFFHRSDIDEVAAYKDFASRRRDGPQDIGVD